MCLWAWCVCGVFVCVYYWEVTVLTYGSVFRYHANIQQANHLHCSTDAVLLLFVIPLYACSGMLLF